MAKLKTVPIGDGWLQVTASGRRRRQHSKAQPSHGYYGLDSRTARYSWERRTYLRKENQASAEKFSATPNHYSRRAGSNRRSSLRRPIGAILMALFPAAPAALSHRSAPLINHSRNHPQASFENLPPKLRTHQINLSMGKSKHNNPMIRQSARTAITFPNLNPARSYAQVAVPATIPPVAAPHHQSTW